jgi:rare lipoprotein A (peptidoglycan hydrolase)
VAVSAIVMNSALCGKTITLTNTKNGKTVNAVIADTCPGCGDGGASIDCSTGTFDALADESDGTFPVTFTLPAV